MNVPGGALLGLVALLALVVAVAVALARQNAALRREARAVVSKKVSQSTRYGQLSEQFAPWMRGFPGDASRFRFLGDPVDGVLFADDAVYLVEIKAADSRLTAGERRVRDLVREGRVGWIEFALSETRAPVVERPWEARAAR